MRAPAQSEPRDGGGLLQHLGVARSMAYDDDDGDGDQGLIETARRQLRTAALDDQARAALAELLDRFETLTNENRRLVRISDQISGDLKLAANTDKLTGVFNRAHFLALAERELERAIRFDRPMSMLQIDVDGFDRLQDKYGAAACDIVLKTLAAASLGVLRRIDSFGRADENGFTALLPETDTTGAVILAERLRDSVANMGVAVGDDAVEFTVSIGVASRSDPDASAEAMLRMADEALKAGRGGRVNRVAIAS